jgi:hypothetical protein
LGCLVSPFLNMLKNDPTGVVSDSKPKSINIVSDGVALIVERATPPRVGPAYLGRGPAQRRRWWWSTAVGRAARRSGEGATASPGGGGEARQRAGDAMWQWRAAA